jgi:hypothetical protein
MDPYCRGGHIDTGVNFVVLRIFAIIDKNQEADFFDNGYDPKDQAYFLNRYEHDRCKRKQRHADTWFIGETTMAQ